MVIMTPDPTQNKVVIETLRLFFYYKLYIYLFKSYNSYYYCFTII